MLAKSFSLFRFIVLILLNIQVLSIYKAPLVFYSQFCPMGWPGSNTAVTVTCNTPIAQQNIIRVGLSLAQYTKWSWSVQGLVATVTPTTGTASSFAITVNTWPWGGGVTIYLNFITDWFSGTAVDNNNIGARSVTQSVDITTNTIFTTGTTGLVLYTFMTGIVMRPNWRSDWNNWNCYKQMQYSVTATISGNNANIVLTAQTETRINRYQGLLLVVNPSQIFSNATQNMAYIANTFSLGVAYNLSSSLPLYGPKFNSKCIIGMYKQKYKCEDTINSYITNTSMGNYQNVRTDVWGTPPQSDWTVFCFGNDTECGQTLTWLDTLTGQCYQSWTCPLPVFSLWTKTNFCPICTQLICLNCSVSNRSNCLTCGPFSTLVSGSCVCDVNYVGIYTAISTFTQGMWNNVASSLTSCKIECSSVSGCQSGACANATFCTACISGYALIIVSASEQYCDDCPSLIANCTICSSPTVCTTCVVGSYVTASFGCELCSVPIAQCATCSSSAICLTCNTGYVLNTTTNLCDCDPGANSLLNCQTCSSRTACATCISNLYYVSSTDNLCYLCSVFDPQCVQCSSFQICTLCNPTYIPQTDANGAILCVPCSTVIVGCDQCSSLTTCTICATTYYLAADATCDLCSNPLSQCVTCTDNLTCLTCATNYTINTSNLCMCDPAASALANCQTCSQPTICTACVSNLYYVAPSDNLCYLCNVFDPQCTQCSAYQVCTLCNTGYIPQDDGTGKILCVPCSTPIPNCTQCSSLTTCTLCMTTYYLLGTGCDLCKNPMPQCVTCTDSATCLTCQIGFTINSTTNLCYCDPAINGLAYCQTCTSLTVCTACASNLYFLSPTNFTCNPCQNFDPQCIECSAFKVCTLCNVGFIPKPNADSTALCFPCSTLIPNCTECSSTTTCTNCDPLYGLTLLTTCMKCDVLLSVPYCSTCEDLSGCFGCYDPTVLAGGKCHFCSQILNCQSCFANALDQLECSACKEGFFLATDTLTGKPACKPCMNLVSYCKTCNQTQCFSCVSPYLIGPDNTCSACIYGYEFTSGFCTNIPGCSKVVALSNGTEVCIACIQQLHFVFDSKQQKCICAEGFKQFIQAGLLPKCIPNCGDGIVLSGYENCDDKNLVNGDGCDSTCNIQSGFQCLPQQPSKCVLHVDFQSITFNYISRVLGSNTGILSFIILPSHPGLQKMAWNKLVTFNFSSTSVDSSELRFSFSSATGELKVIVPYSEELENSDLKTIINLDPNLVVSAISTFVLQNKLNGVNAPLTFEEESMLSTHQNINTISLIMTILLLLQFYVGSYFHKMIGLETIQVIQSIYFARMVAGSSSTSALSSLNVIQYSACGYENAEIFYGSLEDIKSQSSGIMAPEFTLINLKHLFLMNVNLSLIPMFVGIIVYIITLARKYKARNEFLESKQQDQKDRYTRFRRSSQWVYDHFVFPFVMMFNLISFFQTILQLSSDSESSSSIHEFMEEESFLTHLFMVFTTTAILCYEIFCSYEQYAKYKMTPRERERVPKSEIQKLQHDENYPDRANYHPGYVLFYLLYYFLLSLMMIISTMIPGFAYCLEMTLGLSILYFVVIAIWKPYHSSINIHNHFLKIYYGTFVLFMGICYVFARLPQLEMSIYVGLMYAVTGLISVIMVGGFVRIFIEKNFRKSLEGNSSLLDWLDQVEELKEKKKQLSINPDKIEYENISSIKGLNMPAKSSQIISKRQSMVLKNQYALRNQIAEMIKKKDGIDSSNTPKITGYGNLFEQKEKQIIKEFRHQYYKKREQQQLEQIAKQKGINLPKPIQWHKFDDDILSDKDDMAENNNENTILTTNNQAQKTPKNKDSKTSNEIKSSKIKQRSSRANQTPQIKASLLENIKIQLRRQWRTMDEI